MGSRRVRLPGVDEIFRPTAPPPGPAEPPGPASGTSNGSAPGPARGPSGPGGRSAVERPASVRVAVADGPRQRPTGRQRHDSKITVYISSDELLALEQLRLRLRADHALPVDRGRLVREAVAEMIGDFEAHGEHSALVRRLRHTS